MGVSFRGLAGPVLRRLAELAVLVADLLSGVGHVRLLRRLGMLLLVAGAFAIQLL